MLSVLTHHLLSSPEGEAVSWKKCHVAQHSKLIHIKYWMQKQRAGEQADKSKHKLKTPKEELIAEQPKKKKVYNSHIWLELQLSACFNTCQVMRPYCVWRGTAVCVASCWDVVILPQRLKKKKNVLAHSTKMSKPEEHAAASCLSRQCSGVLGNHYGRCKTTQQKSTISGIEFKFCP